MSTHTIDLVDSIASDSVAFKPVDQILTMMHDRVVVNLMLTLQCNFECAHCFFASGPREPKGYMTDEMIDKVLHFCDQVLAMYGQLNINMIGGEPTLNLDQFERCITRIGRYIDRHGGSVTFETTTNGWWLLKEKDRLRFFEIMRPFVDSDGGMDDGIRVRISDSKWHSEQRKGYHKGKSIKGMLEACFDGGEDDVRYATIWRSPCCWAKQGGDDKWETCAGCGAEVEEWSPEDIERVSIPEPRESDPWIYADTWGEESHVIPSHPDRGQFGSNDIGLIGSCHRGETIATFRPNGTLMDACCRGSNMPFGTVDDHPIVLFGLVNTFLANEEPSCRSCHAEARSWSKSQDIVAARAYYEAVVASMECGEIEVKESWVDGVKWTDPLTGDSFLWEQD